MSNPFARFGIEHLSPSSLNTYAANPALWCGKYLMKWRDDSGPSAARGTAVEAGLDVYLYEHDKERAIQAAYQNFHLNTNGLSDEDHESERANLEPMLNQAISALKDWPVPLARQLRIEHWIDGIEVPVIGYIDYMFDDGGLDLKSTKACPSYIRSDHARQVATYSKAKQKPFSVLYVTAKRSAIYPLSDEDANNALLEMAFHARAVRHLLNRASDAKDAMRFFAPSFDEFRWSEKTRELATLFYAPIGDSHAGIA